MRLPVPQHDYKYFLFVIMLIVGYTRIHNYSLTFMIIIFFELTKLTHTIVYYLIKSFAFNQFTYCRPT